MEQLVGLNVLIFAGVIALVVIITIYTFLSCYKKCKPNQLMVIYGQGKKKDKTSKIVQGGGAFVIPFFEGYEYLSMEPIQIKQSVDGAKDVDKIELNVPLSFTIAISKDERFQQNAAERLLGMSKKDQIQFVEEIVFGDMRAIIATMTLEELNSNREELMSKAVKSIDKTLNEYGLYLMNLNISELNDTAGVLKNQGLRAESKAKNEAMAAQKEEEKKGAILIAKTDLEKETNVARTNKEKQTLLAENQKEQDIAVANSNRERIVTVTSTISKQEAEQADAKNAKEVDIARSNTQAEINIKELNNTRDIQTAQSDATREIEINKTLVSAETAKAEFEADIEIKNSQAESKKAIAVETAKFNASSAKIALDAQTKEKEAEAARDVNIKQNTAKQSIIESETALQIAQAESQRCTGAAKILAESELAKTKEIANKEIEDKKSERVAATLHAEKIVPAEVAKNAIIIETDAAAEKLTRETRAKAESIKLLAEAEADAIKMKMNAEAEGKKSLMMAEADMMREMFNSVKGNEEIAVQWKLMDKIEVITNEYANAVSNIKIGDVKIYDNGNGESVGKYINNVMSQTAPIFDVLRSLPLPTGVKRMLNEETPDSTPVALFEEVEKTTTTKKTK